MCIICVLDINSNRQLDALEFPIWHDLKNTWAVEILNTVLGSEWLYNFFSLLNLSANWIRSKRKYHASHTTMICLPMKSSSSSSHEVRLNFLRRLIASSFSSCWQNFHIFFLSCSCYFFLIDEKIELLHKLFTIFKEKKNCSMMKEIQEQE